MLLASGHNAMSALDRFADVVDNAASCMHALQPP